MKTTAASARPEGNRLEHAIKVPDSSPDLQDEACSLRSHRLNGPKATKRRGTGRGRVGADPGAHLSLAKDAPRPRSVQPPSEGKVMAVPRVGGLHHEYLQRAA